MSFATKLRELRKSRQLTQDEFGQKIGIHGRHVGKYETSQVMPNTETAIKVAKFFNVSLDYLLLDAENLSSNDIKDPDLLRYFKELNEMDDKDRETIKSLIDAYLTKKKLQSVLIRH